MTKIVIIILKKKDLSVKMLVLSAFETVILSTCVKRPLKNRQNKDLNDKC